MALLSGRAVRSDSVGNGKDKAAYTSSRHGGTERSQTCRPQVAPEQTELKVIVTPVTAGTPTVAEQVAISCSCCC
jgi:hypothetical protein